MEIMQGNFLALTSSDIEVNISRNDGPENVRDFWPI